MLRLHLLRLPPQLLQHQAVPLAQTILARDAAQDVLDAQPRGIVPAALARFDDALLDAVDVQDDDGAEGVVLREPEGAEDVRGGDVVDDAGDAHCGVEAVGDVGGAGEVVRGSSSGSGARVRGQLGKVGQEEGAVDEQDGVVVRQVEDVALALVDGDEQRGREVGGVEEVRVGAAPGEEVGRVLCREGEAVGEGRRADRVQVAEDRGEDLGELDVFYGRVLHGDGVREGGRRRAGRGGEVRVVDERGEFLGRGGVRWGEKTEEEDVT